MIANDITISIGSFGPKEDLLFLRASELARNLKIPRIYLAANSGARLNFLSVCLSPSFMACMSVFSVSVCPSLSLSVPLCLTLSSIIQVLRLKQCVTVNFLET